MHSLAYGFHVGHSTASEIVIETSRAVYAVLAEEYMKTPTTEDWRNIAVKYSRVWNSPNCVGAIDGKHVEIQCPTKAGINVYFLTMMIISERLKKTGSEYYNYKGFHSTVLLAVCDPDYKFTLIDVGAYGRQGDRSVFASSKISSRMADGSLKLPEKSKIPYSDKTLPYYFNGDEAFPLTEYLMKPFPGRNTGLLDVFHRIFNLR